MRAAACLGLVVTLTAFGCTRQQPLGPAAEAQGAQGVGTEAAFDHEAWWGQWSQRNDVDAEIALLKSPEALERARAAARLRDLAGSGEDSRDISAAVPDLIALLADDSPLQSTDVHPFRSAIMPTTPGDEAALALGSVKPAPAEALRGVLREGPSEAVVARVIRAAGHGRIEALADVVEDALTHPSAEVRRDAYDAIKPVAPDQAATLLRARVDDEEELLAPLLVVLARVDLQAAMPALEKTLDDPTPERRREAAQAVGDIASSTQPPEFHDRFFPRLARALSDEPSAEVRERQAWALSRTRAHADLAAEALLTVVREDPAPKVRAAAASTLGYLEAPAGPRAEALLAALEDDREVQNRAVQGLNRMVRDGEITNGGMPELAARLRERMMAALRTEEEIVSFWAGDVIQRIPGPDSVDGLLALLAERRSVLRAAGALSILAKTDPRLLPALDALVLDEEVPEPTRVALARGAYRLVKGEPLASEEDPVLWWREHRAEYLD